MSDYQTVSDVLTRLVDEGYIDSVPENPPFNTDDNTPIYIKGLQGFGGWVASLFFFLFIGFCLFSTLLASSSETTIGTMLIVLGLLSTIAMAIDSRRDDVGAFFSQVRLAIHIVGHPMLLSGIIILFKLYNYDSLVIPSLIFIAMQLVFIPTFRDATYRFLATIGIVIALNVILYEIGIIGSLSVLIALLALDVVIVWSGVLPAKIEIDYRELILPVGYGVVFGLFGTIAHELSSNPSITDIGEAALHKPFITSLMLLVITIWYEVRLLADYDRPPTHRSTIVLVGLTVIVALPTLTTPGILASILLILLGYRRKHNLLLILAYLFMAGFISYFYYSLQTTLLIKSFILMGTGILFLAGGLSLPRLLPSTTSEEA